MRKISFPAKKAKIEKLDDDYVSVTVDLDDSCVNELLSYFSANDFFENIYDDEIKDEYEKRFGIPYTDDCDYDWYN